MHKAFKTGSQPVQFLQTILAEPFRIEKNCSIVHCSVTNGKERTIPQLDKLLN